MKAFLSHIKCLSSHFSKTGSGIVCVNINNVIYRQLFHRLQIVFFVKCSNAEFVSIRMDILVKNEARDDSRAERTGLGIVVWGL